MPFLTVVCLDYQPPVPAVFSAAVPVMFPAVFPVVFSVAVPVAASSSAAVSSAVSLAAEVVVLEVEDLLDAAAPVFSVSVVPAVEALEEAVPVPSP